MAIPKAIQRDLARAEALQQSLSSPQDSPAFAPESAPGELFSAPEPAPAAPVYAPAPVAPQDSTNWEQKFRTVQGILNAEVPPLRAENKALVGRLAQLEDQMRAVSDNVRKTAEQSKAVEVDPRDSTAFGDDLMEMVQRYVTRALEAMRSEFTQHVGSFEQRVGALESQLTGVSRKAETSLEQAFYADLERAVPDWQAINSSERWLAWLGTKDPVYQLARQAALDSAHQRMDAQHVASIFKEFKGAVPPRESLNDQRNPATVSAGAALPAATGAKPIIRQSEIQAFYTDLARGRYRGREAEASRIEESINLAASEGRVR
jgi:hypothetical protein